MTTPLSPTRGDGVEWVVEAFDADPARLTSRDALAALVDEMVAELALRPVAPALWHTFPGAGGITGLLLLAESHLAVHTFPEHRSLTLNLFCCSRRAEWDFVGGIRRHVGARRVEVRVLQRSYGSGRVSDAVRVPDSGASILPAATPALSVER